MDASMVAMVGCQNNGIPRTALAMKSRNTSTVAAITAPAWASRNSRSMPVCFEKAAPPQARIAWEVTEIAASPAAALDSSTRSMVVSRGRSRVDGLGHLPPEEVPAEQHHGDPAGDSQIRQRPRLADRDGI